MHCDQSTTPAVPSMSEEMKIFTSVASHLGTLPYGSESRPRSPAARRTAGSGGATRHPAPRGEVRRLLQAADRPSGASLPGPCRPVIHRRQFSAWPGRRVRGTVLACRSHATTESHPSRATSRSRPPHPLVATMAAADDAEARGDAEGALKIMNDIECGPDGKPFWRPWRVQRLYQLVTLRDLLPPWAGSRWILG